MMFRSSMMVVSMVSKLMPSQMNFNKRNMLSFENSCRVIKNDIIYENRCWKYHALPIFKNNRVFIGNYFARKTIFFLNNKNESFCYKAVRKYAQIE